MKKWLREGRHSPWSRCPRRSRLPAWSRFPAWSRGIIRSSQAAWFSCSRSRQLAWNRWTRSLSRRNRQHNSEISDLEQLRRRRVCSPNCDFCLPLRVPVSSRGLCLPDNSRGFVYPGPYVFCQRGSLLWQKFEFSKLFVFRKLKNEINHKVTRW